MYPATRLRLIAACALSAAVLTSCGSEEGASGELAPPGEADDAYTYDRTAAPPGAEISVETPEIDNGTQVELTVSGLQPNQVYGAHAHVRPCGGTGDAAGPHFQYRPAPEGRSNDPAFANPRNEIWLDFQTDAQGSGRAIAQVPFDLGDRAPASVVIHQSATSRAPGEAGEAGDRFACLTVPFGS